MRRLTVLVAVAALLATALPPAILRAQDATPAPPSPPIQPATGPGGADYAYDAVVANYYNGQDPPAEVFRTGYWLFEPATPRPGAPPVDTPLPLVLFVVGGMDGVDPEYTRDWIDHLVRRGAVVVFPTGWSMSEIDDTEFQVAAALAELERGGHAPVNLNRVAVVGQGFGGTVAAHLAAAPPAGLPTPTALMVVTPVIPPVDQPSSLPKDLAALPTATRVVLVGAEDAADSRTALEDAWAALAGANRVPATRRAYVTLRSDAHGAPALVASEFVALAGAAWPDQPDALDWYGTWKLLDGLMGCSFAGRWCEYAFGDTPEVRSMGTWSDGVPVKEAVVATEPGTPAP